MVYFIIMNYFLPHKHVITSVQLKQRLQEMQAAFSLEVLHLFGKSGSLTNGLPRKMALREVDDSICSMKSGIKNMHNNLESLSIMRYNKKRKYRIFGDGCNSLPAVIVTDYLAGW